MINWKMARKSVGLTQKQVADKLGYDSSQFVSNWERGTSYPPPKAFRIICKLYTLDYNNMSHVFIDLMVENYRAELTKRMKNA